MKYLFTGFYIVVSLGLFCVHAIGTEKLYVETSGVRKMKTRIIKDLIKRVVDYRIEGGLSCIYSKKYAIDNPNIDD